MWWVKMYNNSIVKEAYDDVVWYFEHGDYITGSGHLFMFLLVSCLFLATITIVTITLVNIPVLGIPVLIFILVWASLVVYFAYKSRKDK